MTTPTLDSGVIPLGRVIKPEKIVLDNNLWKKNLPGTNTSGSLAIDIFGKSRTIIVKGVFTGTEAEMKTFVEAIDTWADSPFHERKVYKSSLNKSYNVRCDYWDYEIHHNRIEYTLRLLQSAH
jgi:hypothetical protein